VWRAIYSVADSNSYSDTYSHGNCYTNSNVYTQPDTNGDIDAHTHSKYYSDTGHKSYSDATTARNARATPDVEDYHRVGLIRRMRLFVGSTVLTLTARHTCAEHVHIRLGIIRYTAM
jgi:hypothetical protein